jgi:hypothetical protein
MSLACFCDACSAKLNAFASEAVRSPGTGAACTIATGKLTRSFLESFKVSIPAPYIENGNAAAGMHLFADNNNRSLSSAAERQIPYQSPFAFILRTEVDSKLAYGDFALQQYERHSALIRVELGIIADGLPERPSLRRQFSS